MTKPITIALDGMGGDIGPNAVVPAALRVLKAADDTVRLILVGQEDVLSAQLARHKAKGHPQIVIRHASQLISMDESPAQALRVALAEHARLGALADQVVTTRDGVLLDERLIAPLLDAGGDQPSQTGRSRCLCQRRQYRRADGNFPLRAQNPTRH